MLQPRKLKSLLNVPHFCPGRNFFILTLRTLRQWLDWPLISVLTSQPMHKTCSSPSKKNFCCRFTRKPLIAEILERYLLVAKKVPYNSQMTLHENCRPFMPQTDDLCFLPQWKLTRTAIARRMVNVEFFEFSLNRVRYIGTFMQIFGSKFRNFQRSRISATFCYVQKSQKVDT